MIKEFLKSLSNIFCTGNYVKNIAWENTSVKNNLNRNTLKHTQNIYILANLIQSNFTHIS